MDKAKLGASQMFSLIVHFEFGSAVVVGLGMQAKQDAWLAVLIGMIGGLALFTVYGSLFRLYPALPLTGYIPKIVGPWLGYPLSIAYILYFGYLASRVLRDLGDLLLTSKLNETPLVVVDSMIMIIVVYALWLGIEVLGRAGEIFIGVVAFSIAAGIVLVFASGIVKPENLMPVLENGWKPVLRTAFPLTLTFPFGEMVAFTMLLPHLNKPETGMKTGLAAMLGCGLILSFVRAMDISVLGQYEAAATLFPLLETISRISVGDVIQRLDAIVIMALVVGGFFKIAVFVYAASLGLIDTFRVRTRRTAIVLVGLAVLAASLFIAKSLTQHLEIGLKVVPLYLHLPFQVGLPLLLLSVALIRRKRSR